MKKFIVIMVLGFILINVVERKSEIGKASFYTVESSSNITASGERFNEDALTCASWKYQMGTILKVTNIENGKSVLVRVNDRGPNKRLKRLIDLTPRAFRKIAVLRKGIITVKVVVIKKGK
jgi:rare lipoprotein A